MTYPDFLRRHGAMALFGYSLALMSCFGQTFFIALSGPDIRSTFGLSNAAFGSIYSTATLCSGLLMIWAGGVLDRISVRTYAAVALAGMAAASLLLWSANGLVMLGIALFGLRLFGQGMLGHAAVTSAARLPSGVRGRAMGLATLGFPTGEAILPGIALIVITTLGWTRIWEAAAATVTVAMVLVLWLKKSDDLPAAHASAGSGDMASIPPRRVDILRDRNFLVFLPAILAPPAIMTGYLFYQRHFATVKGWSLELVAGSLTGYALASVTVGMLFGFAVDRFGGIRMSRLHLLGLILSSLTLAFGSGPASAIGFFVLMGCTAGANNVVVPAVLAELYGTRHLGLIRALSVSIMVVASAATPIVLGFVIDAGFGAMPIALACAAWLAGATALTLLLPDRKNAV